MASAEREPIGQQGYGGGVQGRSPRAPDNEGFLALDGRQEGQKSPLLGILQTVHKQGFS